MDGRNRKVGLLLALIGVLIVIIAVAADWLGIGSLGFRPLQILMTAVGFGLLMLGGVMYRGSEPLQRALRFPVLEMTLVVNGLFWGLLLIEIGLTVFARVDFDKRHAKAGELGNAMRGLLQPVSDPELGWRLPPHAPGHDAKGFRNQTVPEQVDIVAIGDSQTWGINAHRCDAYPQTLERIAGRGVYNMGLGYYGSVEYWVLTKEALELSPKIVVIGLYLGNDIWGAYGSVYWKDKYARFRRQEPYEELISDTVGNRVKALSDERYAFCSQFKGSVFQKFAMVRLLSRHGLFPYAKYEADKAWAIAYPDQGGFYESSGICTVFTTAYRLAALDLNEPQIREGLRITKDMLLHIKARTGRIGVKLLLLLIPTKETVYADAVQEKKGHLNKTYDTLVRMERQIRDEIILHCQENGIKYVNVLPVLSKTVQNNEQIYRSSCDGHPNADGYFLIASALNKALENLGW